MEDQASDTRPDPTSRAVPTLVIVSGEPGSGKTTLAHQLARGIGCPALCRDELKEGMVHSQPDFAAAISDPLSLRTFDLFFTTIDSWLEAGVSLVAEAAFQDTLWRRGLATIRSRCTIVVVRCVVDRDLARTRMLERMATQPTRAAHADGVDLSSRTGFDPINLDRPTIDVDTGDGYSPTVEAVLTFIAQARA